MLTPQQVASLITRSSQYRMTLVENDLAKEHAGRKGSWQSVCLSHYIQALNYRYLVGDFASDTVISVYDGLSNLLGSNFPSITTIDPNAQPSINTAVVQGFYQSPDNAEVPIPAGTPSPFAYIYSGTRKIKGYYVELNAGGGNYYLAPNISVDRNGNTFTLAGDFSADAYKLTIILA